MICVYPADCTDFSNNGLGAVTPMSCTVTETLNGEWELTLVHDIDERGKWTRLSEGCILRAPPRVNFSAPGDDSGAEVYRIHTDFSGAETRAGTLDLAYIAKDSCAEIEKQGASILRKLPAA